MGRYIVILFGIGKWPELQPRTDLRRPHTAVQASFSTSRRPLVVSIKDIFLAQCQLHTTVVAYFSSPLQLCWFPSNTHFWLSGIKAVLGVAVSSWNLSMGWPQKAVLGPSWITMSAIFIPPYLTCTWPSERGKWSENHKYDWLTDWWMGGSNDWLIGSEKHMSRCSADGMINSI